MSFDCIYSDQQTMSDRIFFRFENVKLNSLFEIKEFHALPFRMKELKQKEKKNSVIWDTSTILIPLTILLNGISHAAVIYSNVSQLVER